MGKRPMSYKKENILIVNFFKQSWLVMTAALVFGLLLAVVHGALNEKIEEQARQKIALKMAALFGEGAQTEMIMNDKGEAAQPLTAMVDSTQVSRFYKVMDSEGSLQGYACIAEDSGYADKIKMLIAVDPSMESMLGYAVLKSNETPGFGDKIMKEPFLGQFNNCPIDQKLIVEKTGETEKKDHVIVAITGATVSSEAVTNIVNKAIKAIRENVKPKK